MAGAALSRSGSIDSFREPPAGIEMLSTPPATMQSAPSERMLLAAIAMVCSPDEQKRFTDTPAADFGMPASSVAWRPMCGGGGAEGGPAVRSRQERALVHVFFVDAGALRGLLGGWARHGHRWGNIEPA